MSAHELWSDDVSAATENMLIAMNAYGGGAVWCGVYPNLQKGEAVSNILGLPQNDVVLNVIPLGYPGENPTPKKKWKAENVYYNQYQE